MTENIEQPVEQITKEPEALQEKKQKDPKKVAAGKLLAAYHKKAKEAMKKQTDIPASEEKSWMPELSLTAVISVVGISLTALDLYYRWRKQDKDGFEWKAPPVINIDENNISSHRTGME